MQHSELHSEREAEARVAWREHDRHERERTSLGGTNVMSPVPAAPDLVKSVDQLRAENLELRQALAREADELAGENEHLRAFLGACWR